MGHRLRGGAINAKERAIGFFVYREKGIETIIFGMECDFSCHCVGNLIQFLFNL